MSSINPNADAELVKANLSHWHCVSPVTTTMFYRNDGFEWFFQVYDKADIHDAIRVLKEIDEDNLYTNNLYGQLQAPVFNVPNAILGLEKRYCVEGVEGTTLTRARTNGHNGWCLGLGNITSPKQFVYADTIEDVIEAAYNLNP